MSADPVSSREDRDLMILALKQTGHTIHAIAERYGISRSRVGQILVELGGNRKTWLCPLCGDFKPKLGETGWCVPCETLEKELGRCL